MPKTIDQFMWGFQPLFRISVDGAVERALEAIAAPLETRVVLVGYAAQADSTHAVCIEPETGPLGPVHLEGVLEEAGRLATEDPEADMIHSNARVHQGRQEFIRRRARALATSTAIERSGVLGDVTVFTSHSTLIEGYYVHTCVCVEAERFGALPALDGEYVDRIYVGRSLQHEVIEECLRRADRALYLPDPGAGLNVLDATPDEIVASAARRFATGCVIRTGQWLGGEPFDALNALTAQHYERAPARGVLMMAAQDNPGVTAVVRFARSVLLRESRAVRKLLETTDESVALLADGRDVFGLGNVKTGQPVSGVFRVSVPEHATWQISDGVNELMKVSYGRASLPRPVLDRAAFDDALSRLIDGADGSQLWSYVDAAAGSGHGTTLVISSNAAAEAVRLSGQATLIDPVILTLKMVQRVGRMDGAILVDPAGSCHAVAVILDGEADGAGDPARGSRYNSSVRYQRTAQSATVAVVVSDDGGVDLVPKLRPQVHSADVEFAVASFRAVNAATQVEGEAFARSYRKVRELAFYMNEEQCNEVNELYEAEQQRRLKAGGIAIHESDLHPHPDMDDSYWL